MLAASAERRPVQDRLLSVHIPTMTVWRIAQHLVTFRTYSESCRGVEKTMMSVSDDTVVQCPACGWRGELDEFELVMIGDRALVHCPSCDANLGTNEHVLENCAGVAPAATVLPLD